MQAFDANRAWLQGPDFFPRFVVEDVGSPLEHAGLPAHRELIIAERDGHKAAFVMRELSHPHLAQGHFADKPYLVTF